MGFTGCLRNIMIQDDKDEFKLNAAILVLTRIRSQEDNLVKSTLSHLLEIQINNEQRIGEGIPSSFSQQCKQNGIEVPEIIRNYFADWMAVERTARASGTRLS